MYTTVKTLAEAIAAETMAIVTGDQNSVFVVAGRSVGYMSMGVSVGISVGVSVGAGERSLGDGKCFCGDTSCGTCDGKSVRAGRHLRNLEFHAGSTISTRVYCTNVCCAESDA